MTRDLLDEIKNKWNIPVTLPMAVPWGKDDVVWLVQEIERLTGENKHLRAEIDRLHAFHTAFVDGMITYAGAPPSTLIECYECRKRKCRTMTTVNAKCVRSDELER